MYTKIATLRDGIERELEVKMQNGNILVRLDLEEVTFSIEELEKMLNFAKSHTRTNVENEYKTTTLFCSKCQCTWEARIEDIGLGEWTLASATDAYCPNGCVDIYEGSDF